MARVTQAQQIEALLEQVALLTAQVQAGNTPAKQEPEKVPFLSCWTASRVNANAKGEFSHKSKSGTSKRYRALSADEAHAMLDANLAAGRVYAIPA